MESYLKEELFGLIREEKSVFDFFHESLLDGLWCWDLEKPENGWISQKFLGFLGFERNDVPDMKFLQENLINCDDLLSCTENAKLHINNPEIPFDQVIRFKHKDSSIRWTHCRGLAIRNKEGKAIRFVGAHYDITELKLTEKVLLRSIEKSVANEDNLKFQLKLNQNLVQSIPIPISLKDKEGKYTACNRPFEIATGKTEKEIIGKTVFDIWEPNLASFYNQKDIELMANGGTQVFEGDIKNGQGEIRNVIFNKCTLEDENGEIAGILVTFLDITERKNIETLTRRNKDRLQILIDLDQISQTEEKKIFSLALQMAAGVIETQTGFLWVFGDGEQLMEFNFWPQENILPSKIPQDVDLLMIFADDLKKRQPIIINNPEKSQLPIVNALFGQQELNNLLLVPIFENSRLVMVALMTNKEGGFSNIDVQELTLLLTGVWDIVKKRNYEEELIRAKEKAEESEYKFRASFITSPDSMSINTMDGEFVEINDGFCALSGYTRDEVIGKLSTEIQVWGDLDDRDKWVEMLKKDGHVKNFEANFRAKNGDLIPGLISTSIVRLKNEPHTLSVTREITDRKRYEQALIKAKERAEESEKKLLHQNAEIEFNNERLESLLRISQYQANSIQEMLDFALEEAIKLTGSKIGYIYFYNEVEKQFVLNTWSKDVMNACSVILPQQVYDLDKTGCWGEVVRQRKPIIINDYNAENPHKKGIPEGHIPLRNFLSVPVIIDNVIVAVAGVANKANDYNKSDVRQLTLLMDNVWKITERLTLIENLRVAKEKAEESDRLKTAFLHNLSHEIRTPMNAIIGFSELLYMKYNDDPKLAQFSKIINQRCNDLLVIIDDILDIAKIESGQYPLKVEKCNLHILFKELGSFFKEHQVKMKKQHILLSIGNHLPKGNLILETDTVKLKQIFINLIGNAFKFTDEGSIEAGCRPDGAGNLEFYVSDTGIGIPSEKTQEIFVRFAQLEHSKNRLYGGTGLGLSIVKGLVELLGGKIWVESELCKGSTFYFTLPYQPLENASADVIENPAPSLEVLSKNKKILLVDDDTYNISLIEELLDGQGIHLICVNNGNDALKYALENSPDLILLDIGLPDISGYEVVQKIMQIRPEQKIVAQTAYAAPEDKQMAIEVGCVDYVSKPLKSTTLISVINKHLS